MKLRRKWLALGLASGGFTLAPFLQRLIFPRRWSADIEMYPAPCPLAAFQFVDAQGQAMSQSDFRHRIVMLNIWAIWCGPCAEEMPMLDQLQKRLGSSDFELLALSIDHAGMRVVQAFFERVGIKQLRPLLDNSGLAQNSFSASGFPLTLIIDRDRNEIGRKLGPPPCQNDLHHLPLTI
jgi:thiol-disulfide isomerase/thioredoxin